MKKIVAGWGKKISLETRGGVCVSGLIAIKKLVRASASFAPLLPFYFIISYLGGALSLEIKMVSKMVIEIVDCGLRLSRVSLEIMIDCLGCILFSNVAALRSNMFCASLPQ
jgi:hypothetical protein